MKFNVSGMMKNLIRKNPAPERKERKAGYAVSLGEGGHTIAQYTRHKGRVLLSGVKTVSDEELRSISRGSKPLSVCFSPGSVYADLGDFSSVSREATTAHIRATVDKIGLFSEPYSLSFRNVSPVDQNRARFSYLAIPLSETGRMSVLDEEGAPLDACCPVEASIAALVGAKTGEMCISLFEDERHVRIIGSKGGIIYSLSLIEKLNGETLFSEAIAGVSEMASLMKGTYGEPHPAVFTVGRGKITAADLRDSGIEALPFELEGLPEGSLPCFELLGTPYCTGYDFTPQAHLDTRGFSRLAACVLGISLVMVLVSLCLFLLGHGRYAEAKGYEARARAEQQQYARDLRLMEEQYAPLLRHLDPGRMDALMALYRDFQSEPKLYAMLGTITGAVPADTSLRRMEVMRSGWKPEGAGNPGPWSVEALPPTHDPVFRIRIEGTVAAPYPRSKVLFSAFLSGVQAHYPVSSASFAHTGDQADFRVECEVKK